MNTTTRKLSANLRIIWAIAAKDIVDAIKNKITISVVIGVALTMLSSQALPLITRLSDIRQVVVYDAGESSLIPELMKQRKELKLSVYRVSSKQEMEKKLVEGVGATFGLALPPDFDQALDSGRLPALNGYYVHWISRADTAENQTFFQEHLTQLVGQPVQVSIEGNVVYPQPDSDGRPYMFSTILVVAIIAISGILVPFLMIEEKENRTMDALLISPARISQVIVGKAIAGMVYGLAAAAVVFAFNRALIVHWEWAALAALCGTFFAVAVGLLLGSLFDNPQNMSLWMGIIFVVLLMPVFLAMAMAMTSLPAFLRTILRWIPTAALAKAFRISLSGTVPLAQVLSHLGLVVGSTVLLLAVVVWIVHRSDR